MVGNSKEVGFKARKKLIARKRVLCLSGVCPERRILDLLEESSISGERSCGMIDLQT